MKQHLRERIQLLSRQRDKKIKLLTAKKHATTLNEDKIEAIKHQLATQMNLESRQEVNCSVNGPQHKDFKKELKRKLWTKPVDLAKTRDGGQPSQQQKDAPGLRPELVSGNGEQPQL